MTDKTKAVKLSRAMREIPVETYRLPTDGRKWKRVSERRMALADFLATYGDGDGTRVQAGIKAMMRKFGVSRRTVFYWLDDLKELGILTNTGNLTSERGTRVRQLHPDALRAKAGVQNSGAGVQNTPPFLKAGVQDSVAGVQNTAAGVQNSEGRGATYGCTQPPLLTDTPPPPPPPHVAPTPGAGGQVVAVVSDLQRAYQQSTGKVLPVSGKGIKDKLSAMVSAYSPDTIARAVEQWVGCRTAPASGLRNPAQFLLDELPDFLVQVDEAAKVAAKLAAELPRLQSQAEEMSAQYRAWNAQLDAFAQAETEKFLAGPYPPHNTVIDAVIDEWVSTHPSPTDGLWTVNQDGQLFGLRDWDNAVQQAKAKIYMATEQMGQEQAAE